MSITMHITSKSVDNHRIASLSTLFSDPRRCFCCFLRLSGAHILVTTLPWALIAAAAAAVQIFPIYVGVILAALALLAAQNWVSAVVLMFGSIFSTNQFLAMFGGKSGDVSAAADARLERERERHRIRIGPHLLALVASAGISQGRCDLW